MKKSDLKKLPGNPIAGPEQHSEEWEQLRTFDPERDRPVIIGSSDAAAACGMSPYESSLEFYLKKRGEQAHELSPDAQERVALGRFLEPGILDMYQWKRGVDVIRGWPMLFHSDIDWMAASPDGVASDTTATWCVDAKNSGLRVFDAEGQNAHMYGQEGTDQVPAYQVFQAQHLMEVMGVEEVVFPVLKAGQTLMVYTVSRNDNLIKKLLAAEKEMVERIVNGDAPDPDYSHKGTRQLVGEMYGLSEGASIELTQEDADLWDRQQRIGRLIQKLTEKRQEISSRLLFKAEDNEYIDFPDADYRVKRIVVDPVMVSVDHVRSMVDRLGRVYRNGSTQLRQVKKKHED